MIPLALGAAVSPLAFAGAIALMTGPSPLVTTFALYVPALKLIEESGVGAYLLVHGLARVL